MPVKVCVVSDSLAINFLVYNDIDGFKEFLESDEFLNLGVEPKEFDS